MRYKSEKPRYVIRVTWGRGLLVFGFAVLALFLGGFSVFASFFYGFSVFILTIGLRYKHEYACGFSV